MGDGKITLPLVGKDDVNSAAVIPSSAVGPVSYQPAVCQQIHQSNVRSPPSMVENLKNGNANGSQNNLSNGILPNANYGLTRKVQNNSPNAQRKNLVVLTHLPKRPPVDIAFTNISYSVSEGRKRGFKTILKGVSDKFRSGELTALMGPSGAGKSTLMNILAGYKTSHVSGSISINGKERNLRRFRKLSCYIMQDDRLMPYLTVKEAMMVSANLKLGKDMKMETKKVVVEEILDAIGLIESCNTKTLNLSGGQRKRLSIALELVNNPPVMFFDEPTSGLDSTSCFQLISLLKSLARGGRTVVCTIHQPSARLFETFDHLHMLAEGQCIYQGRVEGLVPFLASLGYECPSYHNPADYVMEVASGEYGEAVHKLVLAVKSGKYSNISYIKADDTSNLSVVVTNGATSISNDISKPSSSPSKGVSSVASGGGGGGGGILPTSSGNTNDEQDILKVSKGDTVINMPNNEDTSLKPVIAPTTVTTSLLDSNECIITLPNKGGFPTSGWQQFCILMYRTFITIIRDQQLTHMRLAAHVIVGAIIGMIYYNIGNDASKVMSNAGCIFFTTLFTMFTAMMPTILTFPMEMGVFIREHLNYWYSLKAFYFAKTLADLPFQIVFTSVYVIVVYYLTSQPMEPKRLAMFVLICILTSLVAQSLGLLIGAGLSVEAGVFIGPVSTIPTILFSGFFVNFDTIPGYLQWVTYVSYVRYSFEGAMVSIYGMDREKLQCSEMYCHYRSPRKFLEQFTMEEAEYWIDAVALVVIFVSLRIISYFVLRWKLHSIR